jgi:hypothetical protein
MDKWFPFVTLASQLAMLVFCWDASRRHRRAVNRLGEVWAALQRRSEHAEALETQMSALRGRVERLTVREYAWQATEIDRRVDTYPVPEVGGAITLPYRVLRQFGYVLVRGHESEVGGAVEWNEAVSSVVGEATHEDPHPWVFYPESNLLCRMQASSARWTPVSVEFTYDTDGPWEEQPNATPALPEDRAVMVRRVS